MSIDRLIFDFFLFSVVGWIIELLYRSVRYKKPVNPGFLFGPYVPLYGAGAVILIITHHFISDQEIIVRAIVYLIVTTALEYLTGEALLVFFKKKYWDYSSNFLNFRGLICPGFSLAWVAASFVFEFILYPISSFVTGHATLVEIRAVNLSMVFTLTFDFVYSSGLVFRVREAVERYDFWSRDRFREQLEQLAGSLVPALNMARKRLVEIRSEMPEAREMLRRYSGDLARRAGAFEWRKK